MLKAGTGCLGAENITDTQLCQLIKEKWTSMGEARDHPDGLDRMPKHKGLGVQSSMAHRDVSGVTGQSLWPSVKRG